MNFDDENSILVKRFVSNCNNIALLTIDSVFMNKVPEILNDRNNGEGYEVIDLFNDFSPLKPFMEIIASNNPSEQDIEEHVYKIQQKTFKSYINTKTIERRYDILKQSEISYEKKRIRTSVIELLHKLNHKNYIILNSQYLGAEALDIIKDILYSQISTKFIFCFDIADTNNHSSEIRNFIDDINNKDYFINLSDMNFESHELGHKSFSVSTKNLSFDLLYNSIRNNRLFLSSQQALEFSDIAEKYSHMMELSDIEEKKLYLEVGLTYFYSSMFEKAVLCLTQLIEDGDDSEETACALFYLAQCFYIKRNFVSARKYLNIFFNKKCYAKDNPYYILCLVTDYYISDQDDSASLIEKYKRTLEALKNSELKNWYVTFGTLIPWSILDVPEYKNFIENQIEESYILSQQIDNQHAVAEACQWRAVVFSAYGKKEEALEWYTEADRIRTEIGDREQILLTRNGISYEACTRAKYTLAYEIINEVIDYLYTVSDSSSIINTLKNIAYAAFYSRSYSLANSIFDVILVYLDIFKNQKSPYSSFLPTYEDIMLFKSLIEIDQGDFVHSKINYYKILQKVENLGLTEKPLLYLLNAVLKLEEKKIDEAMEAVAEAINAVKNLKSFENHKICFICYEFSVMLGRFGYNEEAEYYLQQGFQQAKTDDFSYYTKNQENISLTEYFNGLEQLPKLQMSLHFLNERAEKELLFIKFHQRISDYQFLNSIKSVHIKENLQNYARSVISLIYEYSTASNVELVIRDKENIRLVCRKSKNKNLISRETWQKLFTDNDKHSSIHIVYEPNENLYFCACSHLDSTLGLAIMDESNNITSDMINTLEIAISSIYSELVIFRQNSDLQFYSSTDQLSLLKNRHSLQTYMKDRSQYIQNYLEQNKTLLRETVVFIDLDNFKYYNDKFGHELGDIFIKKFAELLRKIFRRDDFIARFGGDEFIIILPEVTNEQTKKITSKIYTELMNQECFIPLVKEFVKGKEIDIPEDLHLGFSLGFCCNSDVEKPYDLSDVLSKADKAMYHSKTHGKGIVTDWKDIRDEEN